MPTQNALSTSSAVTPITADHAKGCKATELFRAQYNKAGLDEESAQYLNENPDFPAALADAIKKFSISNQYANEEVQSNYTYPGEYKYQQIEKQVKSLKKAFPKLDVKKTFEWIKKVFPKLTLPAGAEGWFAVVKPEKLGETYEAALTSVLDVIKSSRTFYNYREGQLAENYLRQMARTKEMFAAATVGQDGDVVIIPAQFGLRHRGRSVRRARAVFARTEFGLGAVAAGCMLITHPERLVRWEQLYMDLPGDEVSPDASGSFLRAPLFVFHGGEVKFDAGELDDQYARYGSVSGFVPRMP